MYLRDRIFGRANPAQNRQRTTFGDRRHGIGMTLKIQLRPNALTSLPYVDVVCEVARKGVMPMAANDVEIVGG